MDNNIFKAKTIKEASQEAIDYIKGRRSGELKSYKTGWENLNNELLNGFEEGTINLIAGLSGSGKTLLMANLEDSIMALNGTDFISVNMNFEMLSRNLILRKISAKKNLPIRDLLSASEYVVTDEDLKEIEEYLNEIKDQNVLYFDTPKSIKEIHNTLSWVYQKNKQSLLLFIDHSLLVKKSAHHSGTTDMLYELGEALTQIKKEFPITIFVISQLNREIESADRKKIPSMHFPNKQDISYGDALYFHADFVLVSHIPYMLNLRTYGPTNLPAGPNDIYWHILKNRANEAFKILPMLGNFKHMKIEEKK